MRFFAEYLNFQESVCFDVMGIGGIASAAGSVASGAMQAAAANHAADLQSAAANRAMDMQLAQYNQTQNNLAPYRDLGQGAEFKLANLFGLVSQQQQNGVGGGGGGGSGGGAPPAAAAPSPPSAASGWKVQPFGGVAGDGSYEHVVTDPNGTQYYLAYTKDGSLGAAYDANGNQITGPALATITSAIASGGSSSAAPLSVSISPSASGATGSNGLPELGTGTPDMNVLAPFGINSLTYNPATYGLGNGVFQPTEEQLENMPGYKFTLDQGLKASQNGYASRGLGSSGAAMKGAAAYATGLADNTVNTEANIFNNNVRNTQGIFQSNLSNVLTPLISFATGGQNAAVRQGQIGANGINSAANSLIGGANASAAGSVGAANAIGGGINNGINNALQYSMINRLMQNNNSGGGNSDGFDPFAGNTMDFS